MKNQHLIARLMGVPKDSEVRVVFNGSSHVVTNVTHNENNLFLHVTKPEPLAWPNQTGWWRVFNPHLNEVEYIYYTVEDPDVIFHGNPTLASFTRKENFKLPEQFTLVEAE